MLFRSVLTVLEAWVVVVVVVQGQKPQHRGSNPWTHPGTYLDSVALHPEITYQDNQTSLGG